MCVKRNKYSITLYHKKTLTGVYLDLTGVLQLEDTKLV